ncbi:MAG TPA: ATPase, partial [Clostridiales bacterium]|nr:ATPase [Clostridiales bacterium]
DDAGVALPCYNVTEPQPPLQLNAKHNLFKLFMNDSGLLCAASMDNIQFSILNGDLSINMGSILENMIATQLKSKGFRLNYFDSKKYGELDFVIQNGTHIECIEVKSGNDFKKHSALNKILSVAEWKIPKSYVVCRGNVAWETDVIYLPWDMMMFISPSTVKTGTTYKVDITSL